MQKSLTRYAAAVIALVSGGILAWYLLHREPTYQGKTVSEWMRQVSHVPNIGPRKTRVQSPFSEFHEPTEMLGLRTNLDLASSRFATLSFKPGAPRSLQDFLRGLKVETPGFKPESAPFLPFESHPRPVQSLQYLPLVSGKSQLAISDGMTDSERACLAAIRAIGDKAVGAVINSLERDDPVMNRKAAWALGEIGPATSAVMPALIEMYRRGDSWPQQAYAWIWQHLPRRSKQRFSTPVSHSTDRQACAASAIVKISNRYRYSGASTTDQPNPARLAVPAIVARLNDSNEGMSFEAAQLLGEIGPDAIEAVPALVKKLSAKTPAQPRDTVSDAAIIALGSLGPGAKPAIPPLLEMLESGDPGTRWRAYAALSRIDPKTVQGVDRPSNLFEGAKWVLPRQRPEGREYRKK